MMKRISGRYAEMLDKYFGVKDSLWEFGTSGCLLPIYHQNFAQRIIDAEVREDDIWFIGYPKTGYICFFCCENWRGFDAEF